MCDFSHGFRVPEIVKERPVIVFKSSSRSKLVTVIPLSTVEPNPHENYHLLIPKKELPNIAYFNHKDSWLKGDMVYTVGWHRLSMIQIGRHNGKRQYYNTRISLSLMTDMEKCVLNGIGLNRLVKSV